MGISVFQKNSCLKNQYAQSSFDAFCISCAKLQALKIYFRGRSMSPKVAYD